MASPNPYEVAAQHSKATAVYAQLRLDVEAMSIALGEPQQVDAFVLLGIVHELTLDQWRGAAERAGVEPLSDQTRDNVKIIASIWATAEERQHTLVSPEDYLESAVIK